MTPPQKEFLFLGMSSVETEFPYLDLTKSTVNNVSSSPTSFSVRPTNFENLIVSVPCTSSFVSPLPIISHVFIPVRLPFSSASPSPLSPVDSSLISNPPSSHIPSPVSLYHTHLSLLILSVSFMLHLLYLLFLMFNLYLLNLLFLS